MRYSRTHSPSHARARCDVSIGNFSECNTTAPTSCKAVNLFVEFGILREITGKQRDRVFAYHRDLEILTGDDA